MAPAASTRLVMVPALAARTVVRRGMAVKVARIMPLLYSPLIAAVARMTTTAWLRYIPVRLIRAASRSQLAEGHLAAASAAAPRATVRVMTANSSQIVPGRVSRFVHSARSASRRPVQASRMLVQPAGSASAKLAWLMRLSSGAG